MMRHTGRCVLFVSTLALVLGSLSVAFADDDSVPRTVPNQAAPLLISPPISNSLLGPLAADPVDPNSPYLTGIPRGDGRAEAGTAASADSIVEASRAKQWVSMPWTTLVGRTVNSRQGKKPGDPVASSGWLVWEAQAFAISPDGSSHPYGDFAPVAVHSVAFGSVPVTFTIHVSQTRDDNDLPIPLKGLNRYGGGDPAQGYNKPITDDGTLTGQVDIRLSDLVVDGVPVRLGNKCQTVRPAEISLTGKGFYWGDPQAEDLPGIETDTLKYPAVVTEPWKTTQYYDVIAGGLLEGSVDVPPFAGCGEGAEDFSPLVTNVASASGNTMKTRQSAVYSRCIDTSRLNPDDIAVYWVFYWDCLGSVPFMYPTGGDD